MNLNYIVQRTRLFKKRTILTIKRKEILRVGTVGLFSLKKQRFELIYLRFLKKALRRKHIKRKI